MLILLLPCLPVHFSSTGLSLTHVTLSVRNSSHVRARWWGDKQQEWRTTHFRLQLSAEERKKIPLRFIPGWRLASVRSLKKQIIREKPHRGEHAGTRDWTPFPLLSITGNISVICMSSFQPLSHKSNGPNTINLWSSPWDKFRSSFIGSSVR